MRRGKNRIERSRCRTCGSRRGAHTNGMERKAAKHIYKVLTHSYPSVSSTKCYLTSQRQKKARLGFPVSTILIKIICTLPWILPIMRSISDLVSPWKSLHVMERRHFSSPRKRLEPLKKATKRIIRPFSQRVTSSHHHLRG